MMVRFVTTAAVLALVLAPGALAQSEPEAPEEAQAIYDVEEIHCGSGVDAPRPEEGELPEDTNENEGMTESSARLCAAVSEFDYFPVADGFGTTSILTYQSATVRCKSLTGWRRKTNGMYITLWKYFLRIDWCYDGNRITSLTSRRWAEIYKPFWEFSGHVGWSASGGVGSVQAMRWTQGKFRLCFEWCAATYLPWVELRVNARGEWARETGGT
jgi:hypothetical protein